jgi:hypothetical protein
MLTCLYGVVCVEEQILVFYGNAMARLETSLRNAIFGITT